MLLCDCRTPSQPLGTEYCRQRESDGAGGRREICGKSTRSGSDYRARDECGSAGAFAEEVRLGRGLGGGDQAGIVVAVVVLGKTLRLKSLGIASPDSDVQL